MTEASTAKTLVFRELDTQIQTADLNELPGIMLAINVRLKEASKRFVELKEAEKEKNQTKNLTMDQAKAIFRMLSERHCPLCHHDFTPSMICHYPENNGWILNGFSKPQWLYIECNNPKCGHKFSLNKLGVLHRNLGV